MRIGPHEAQSTYNGDETYGPDLPNDEISMLMDKAIGAYQQDVIAADDPDAVDTTDIELDFVSWENAEGQALEATLSADGYEMVTYYVIDNGWDGVRLVFVSSENSDEGIEMVCR